MARQKREQAPDGDGAKAGRRNAAKPGPSAASVDAMEQLTQNLVLAIKVIAWAMGLAGVGYQLLNAPLDRVTQEIDNTTLMKVGLVIFFFGWLWGATNDTKIQKVGYCADPHDARLGLKEFAGILIFLAVFVSLFVLHDDLVLFQLLLLVFILVNSWTWRVIFDRTRPMIDTSYQTFSASNAESQGNCSLAKLLVVVQYMNGPWQRRRFVTLIVLAALQVVASILVARGTLAPLAGQFSFRGVSGAVLLGYLPGMLFIVYVLISEIWMKIYRIKVFADINTIDYLERHFTISKQRHAALPEPHLAGTFDFSPSANRNYVGHGPLKWLIGLVVS
jgi:hypothetical protein